VHKWLAALGLLAGLAPATTARAQSYPARTITLTVTAAAGGVTDVVARALGQRLAEAWGQQVVIENKGGAAHVVGAQSVAKAAPDGYSLLVAEGGTATWH
jgi:tripartite-type tricarboxylate transporter receptor subunit TctC